MLRGTPGELEKIESRPRELFYSSNDAEWTTEVKYDDKNFLLPQTFKMAAVKG